jgi:uncharacterized protein (TIGR03067 family)
MRLLGAAVLAALSLGGVPKTESLVEVRRTELEGDWEWRQTGAFHTIHSGKAPESPARRVDLRIRGHRMTGGEHWPRQATFHLRPTVQPKRIDVVFLHGDGRRALLRGAYRLEGDFLEIWLGKGGGAVQRVFKRVRR